jgi:uncharacterized protein YjbJ (UPF0337 family)
MNKNQIKGAVTNAAGKLQEQTGKLVGSTDQQVKGIHMQINGHAETLVGDMKEVLKDATKK